MKNSLLRQKREEEARMESQILLESKVFSVRKEVLHFENSLSENWFTVEHPGAVAMIPVTKKGNLLLIQQWRRPVRKIIYEIPAGCLHNGERVEECVQRELQEEINFKAKQLISLGSFYSSPGYCTEIIHLFIAKELIPSSLKGDEHEAIDVEEIPLSRCLEMIDSGIIQDAKTILSLLRYARWINA